MINTIRIMNFESHKDTVIKPGQCTNAIIGESENGKSAILRAISWVAFNRPLGDEYRSKWGGSTKVILELDTYRIIREKSDKENCYWIEGVDGYKKKLAGFGQGVPQEITKVLGLLPLNFQSQFDSHFLLPPVSPGEVARKLNEVVDMEIIDSTQANINSYLREVKRSMVQIESGIKNQREEKINLSWIKDADGDLKNIEKIEQQLNTFQNKEQRLSQLLWEIERVEKEISKLFYVNEAKIEFNAISSALDKRKQYIETEKKLFEILDTISELDTNIIQIQGELKIKENELKKKFPATCPLCGQEIKHAIRP